MTETAFTAARAEMLRQIVGLEQDILERQEQINDLEGARQGILIKIEAFDEAYQLLIGGDETAFIRLGGRRRDGVTVEGAVDHANGAEPSRDTSSASQTKAVNGGVTGGESAASDPERAAVADLATKSAADKSADGSASETNARSSGPLGSTASEPVSLEGGKPGSQHGEAGGSPAILRAGPPTPRTDPRALSTAEWVTQSNALAAALENAGPDGIIAENAMVAAEVVEEAVIAGWATRGVDHRGVERLYWRAEAAPVARAAE